EIGEMWMSLWQRTTGKNFAEVWAETLLDGEVVLKEVSQALAYSSDAYMTILQRLRLFDDSQRGNGLLTAIAAVALVWCEEAPEEGLAVAANAIGSDTDTTATMAGALYGGSGASPPKERILDHELLSSEADRMTALSTRTRVPQHQ